MNKKLLMTGAALALGSVMLVTTAFASMSGVSGYEAYKGAVKNSKALKSFTGNFVVSVKDNGNSLIDVNSILKANHQDKFLSSMEVTAKTADQQKDFSVYNQDGEAVIKSSDSDVYNVIEQNGKFKERRLKASEVSSNPESAKAGETIVDALVGDMKNYFTVNSKSDGGSEVSFNMTGSQIPAAVNAIVSAGIKEAGAKNRTPFSKLEPFGSSMELNIPKLTEDIRVNSVDFKAEINKDDYIENQVANINVTGKDADGKEHNLTIKVDASFDNFNNTNPDTVDLNGKQVKTIKAEDLRHRD